MLRRRIATATAAICLMGLARLAIAQNNSDDFRPFNGFFAGLFDDGSQPQPPRQKQQPVQSNSDYNALGTPQPHRIPTRAPQPQPASQGDAAPPIAPMAGGGDNSNPALPGHTISSNTRSPGSATGNNYTFQYDDGSAPMVPALESASGKQFGGRGCGNFGYGPHNVGRHGAARTVEGLPPIAVWGHGADDTFHGRCCAFRPACRTCAKPAGKNIEHCPADTDRGNTAGRGSAKQPGPCRAATPGDRQAGQRGRPGAERTDGS